MASPPDLAVLYATHAALNLLLAALVLGVKPRRTANVVIAVLFVGNALFGIRQVLVHGAVVPEVFSGRVGAAWDTLANAPTLGALVVFPFLFPARRLSRRAERALLLGVGAWVAAHVVLVAAGLQDVFSNNPARFASSLFTFTPYYAGLALGTLLLLDTYLGATSRIQRDQARFALAAYGMKGAAVLATILVQWGVLATVRSPAATFGPIAPEGLVVAWMGLFVLTVGAVAIGIAASRWRHRGREGRRSMGEDAFLLLALVVGALLSANLLPGSFADSEYMLVRPLLFAYAVLQYQLLDVDLHTRRGVVGATFLTGLAGAFLVVALGLQDAGVQPGVAAGVGLVVAIGLGGVLAWPVLRALLRDAPEGPDPRGRDLYRAALEEAVAARDGHSHSEDRILRSLRARLQISDREHALLEGAVRATMGRPADGLAPGTRFLNRYRVEAQLGEGGFGRAFLAHDEQVGRKVVLKAARAASPEDARRMLREARLLAKLDHPGIVRVHDVEQVGEQVVLVLEYLDGGSLADRLRQGPQALEEAARVLDDVLAALEAAHAQGIVHRDLKPANILLTRDGRAKLADFGVARAPPGSSTVTGFTADGQQPGSLRYMSPEQVRGREVDARSDLYSLGVVGYEMLAGRPYLDLPGAGEFDVRLAILEQKPALPLRGVPAAVSQLLAECLAKSPSRRPRDAAEFRRRLAAAAGVARESPGRTPPAGREPPHTNP